MLVHLRAVAYPGCEGLDSRRSMLYEIGTNWKIGRRVSVCPENMEQIENAIPPVLAGKSVPLRLILFGDPPRLTPDRSRIETSMLECLLVSVEVESTK